MVNLLNQWLKVEIRLIKFSKETYQFVLFVIFQLLMCTLRLRLELIS